MWQKPDEQEAMGAAKSDTILSSRGETGLTKEKLDLIAGSTVDIKPDVVYKNSVTS